MPAAEPHKLFPLFWLCADVHLRKYLPQLGIDDDDAEVIRTDLLRRCAHIVPVLPIDPDSEIHFKFGALFLDAVSAEQRLFAAQCGRLPGRLLGDWMPTPDQFEHPFLIELQKVLSEIEADANRAGRRLN